MGIDRFELPVEGLPAAQLCLAQRMPAGDPASLRATARRSGAFAWELRHGAEVLLAGAESSLWRGTAHQALTVQLRSHAPQLRATADRYDRYADALFSYAGVLDETATQLRVARRQLQQRADELASRQHYAGQPPLTGIPGCPASVVDPGADLLPVARTFKAHYDRWADGLDRCSRALRRAGDSDPTRDLHGMRALGHQLGHVAAEVLSPFEQAVLHPSLAHLSACLGELNVGLSVLGLGLLFICPPAGAACLAAATVLGAAQVAVDSTRRFNGEFVSNTSLGFELAAAIPLGGNAFRTLRAADDVVHLVPGGGLMAHEGVDGAHTLAKHVGKSEEYLLHRLATEPGISAASTFYDRQTAENAISGLLRAKQAKVDRWLAGRLERLVLISRDTKSLGILVPRGSTEFAAAQGIKIVLKRNAKMVNGYVLYTAMVTE